jgi:hypothetical protein
LGNARQRRLLAYLQQYDIELHYIKGSQHKSADFLSRLPEELSEAERVQWAPSDKDDLDDYLLNISSENEVLSNNETNKVAEKINRT